MRCYYQSLSRKRVFVFTLSFRENSSSEQEQKRDIFGKTKKQRVDSYTLLRFLSARKSFLRMFIHTLPPLIFYGFITKNRPYCMSSWSSIKRLFFTTSTFNNTYVDFVFVRHIKTLLKLYLDIYDDFFQ